MVISTQMGSRIHILSKLGRNLRAGNNRAHSPQDPMTSRNRFDGSRCSRTVSTSDELQTVLQIEVDTKLLTGDLDQDIEILSLVA